MSSANICFEGLFSDAPVMAILRGMGRNRSVELATAAWNLGIHTVELPLQTEEDIEALREVVRIADGEGQSVGAGTITSEQQITIARSLGADYLVSPGYEAALVETAHEADLPILPGVATPSEVQAATTQGLTWLKAFPATWLGTEWFAHIRGPFPDVKFVATGGIDALNARTYLKAGASAVAVGSALQDPEQLKLLAKQFY